MAESERMTAEKVVGCLLVRDGPDPSARVGHVGVPAADGDPRLAPLSERERDIVHLVALGYTNQEIGKKLFVSVRTVDIYRAHIVRSSSSKRQLRS